MQIKLENVSYIYNKGNKFEKRALDRISLEINQGEFIGLIGHTGSGKSTLMNILFGMPVIYSPGGIKGELSLFCSSP